MSDEVTQQTAESLAGRSVSREHYDWMVQNRNEWQQKAEALGGAAQRLTLDNCRLVAERDAAQADLKQAEENNHGLMTELQNMRAGLEVATEERDNWQQRAELSEHEKQKTADAERRAWLNYDCAERLKVERDAARADLKQAEAKCQKLHAENEGLRADALAYPPQRIDFQQYVTLKADYERQEIVIETLQEGLKRTETLLAKAQAQDIDPRLKGFLSVISQLADQAQDLLP